ncbi:MAG: HEAT repeat domain-containing protein [Anaerolineaceae bacterium]|nr:HEAT repeat domain-containing protein [Anaerolineaceae bacterium]
MNPINESNAEFRKALDALLDMSKDFPPSLWNQFSDLESDEINQLKQIWDQVEVKRKENLMAELENLLEINYQVSFNNFARFCLNDDEPAIRSSAIRLLDECTDSDIADTFLDMMENDADDEVRAAAAAGLGTFVYLGELDEYPKEKKEEIERRLFQIFEQSDDALIQRKALESLSFSSRERVVPLILAAYEHPAKEWKITALFAMGRSADYQWSDKVIHSIQDPDPDLQFEAVVAAGELSLMKAHPYLLKMIEEPDSVDQPTRMAAIKALGEIGGDGTIEALAKLLDYVEDDEEAELIDQSIEFVAFTQRLGLPDMFDFDPFKDEADMNGVVDDDDDHDQPDHKHDHDHDHPHTH